MVQINEIEPSRFRAGDLITIKGFGFSPTFGANAVAIDGIPEPVQSESDSEITLIVPAGITEDAYVPVFVFRSDTLDNDSVQAWSKGDLDDLRAGVVRPPGQVPGLTERADPSRIEDVPQAQDHERLMTALEHLLFDVLTMKGDVFAQDGTQLTRQPVGATPDHRLGANPATSTGMEYAARTRTHSLAWAGGKDPSDNTLGGLRADGAVGIQGDRKEQLAGIAGTLYRLVAFFSFGNVGETIDQVVVQVNGGTVYDSGTGLGVPVLGSHVAALAVGVVATDVVAVLLKKLGGAGGTESGFTAHVGVR